MTDDLEKAAKPKPKASKILDDLMSAIDDNALFPDDESRNAAKRALREGFDAEEEE